MHKKHNMGIGHHIPLGINKAKYAKLKQKWDKKLAESGFIDIEQGDGEGFVSPVFTQVHGNTSTTAASHMLRKYTPEKAEFYRQCGIFLTCFNWTSMTKKNYPELQGLHYKKLKRIWELYADGHSVRIVCEKLPPSWGIIFRQARTLLDFMRQISATFNRQNPNGGNYHSDF